MTGARWPSVRSASKRWARLKRRVSNALWAQLHRDARRAHRVLIRRKAPRGWGIRDRAVAPPDGQYLEVVDAVREEREAGDMELAC